MKIGLIYTAICVLFLNSCGMHSINYEPKVDEKLLEENNYSLSLSDSSSKERATKLMDFKSYSKDVWWQSFSDERLDQFISDGLKSNYDLKAALARITKARYLRSASGAQRLPTLNARGNYQEVDGGFGIQGPFTEAALTLSWELDIFNRLGYQRTQLLFAEKATEEDYEALRLTLSSEIALTYFRIIEINNRLKLLDKQIKIGNEYLNVIRLRFKEGYSSKVDVLQQESQLLNLKSQIPRANEELRVQQNKLDILLGETPDGKERFVPKKLMNYSFDYSVGVPSELLLSRPDLRAASARVVSQDAAIGSAFADRFPSFSITGNLINRDVPVYGGVIKNFTGGVLLPIIDFGRRRDLVNSNEADYKAILDEFSGTFINAVAEVENLLYQIQQRKALIVTLSKRRDVLDETLSQATKRYKKGITDYLPVLNAIESLNETEILLLSERRSLIELQIGLHKAIGGHTHQTKAALDQSVPNTEADEKEKSVEKEK